MRSNLGLEASLLFWLFYSIIISTLKYILLWFLSLWDKITLHHITILTFHVSVLTVPWKILHYWRKMLSLHPNHSFPFTYFLSGLSIAFCKVLAVIGPLLKYIFLDCNFSQKIRGLYIWGTILVPHVSQDKTMLRFLPQIQSDLQISYQQRHYLLGSNLPIH